MPSHDALALDPMRTALEYFNGQWPASQYSGITFWRWEDDHNVVAWDDGGTIAFRDELHGVLRRLSPNGLPPLDSVLLLVAATRDTWRRQSHVLASYRRSLEAEKRAGNSSRAEISEALAQLDQIHEMDAELRTPVLAKAQLAELIFDSTKERTAAEVAERAVRLLETGMYDIRLPTVKPLSEAVYYRCLDLALRRMAPGLKRISEDSLRLRASTGLEVLPQPAQIPEIAQPDSVRMRTFLKVLEADEEAELAGLSRLAKILMAAISVPRTITDPEILPLGGVEDISNRGPLDRLLPSELAYDGDLLAARIANGEALYWRRERPPSPRPKYRYVLLESGLRSWGLPRLFAVATAMATIANADRNTTVNCFRAANRDVVPIDLFTRQGLIDHLAILDTEAHPGQALEAFRDELLNAEDDVDATMILHSAILHDFEFLEVIGKSLLPPMLVASVDGAGNLAVVHRSVRGAKPMGRYKIELETLFATPTARKQSPLRMESIHRDGPAILFAQRMPLRLGHVIRSKRVASVAGIGIFAITTDKRLMLWNRTDLGAVQLIQNLPARDLEILWNSDDILDAKTHLILRSTGSSEAWLVEMVDATQQCTIRTLSLDRRSHADVAGGDGCVYFVWENLIQTFSLESGIAHPPLAPDGWITCVTGRFVQFTNGAWAALSFDGSMTQLQAIPADLKAVAIIERRGNAAPIAITPKGELRSLDSTAARRVKDLTFEKHSKIVRCKTTVLGQNCFLAINGLNQREEIQIDLEKCEAVERGYYDVFLSKEIYRKITNDSLRNKFHSIGVAVDTGLLTLRTLRQLDICCFSFALVNSVIRMNGRMRTALQSEIEFKNFDAGSSERGFKLSVADWQDGSRAFLDSRGMLHLQSSDRSLPELSLVLKDGVVSGWCSDSRLFGEKYYTGQESDQSASEIFRDVVHQFVARLA